MNHHEVCFVPKRQAGPEPWRDFGSNLDDYERWIPHICGVCCLKMVGDTLGRTRGFSLYDLTIRCLDHGAFRVHDDGEIEGIFHYPLAAAAEGLGIPSAVKRSLSALDIINHVSNRRLVVLSIDLAKLTPPNTGSHLVLVYGFDPSADAFWLHDCSSVVRPDGRGIVLARGELDLLSNEKGLVMG